VVKVEIQVVAGLNYRYTFLEQPGPKTAGDRLGPALEQGAQADPPGPAGRVGHLMAMYIISSCHLAAYLSAARPSASASYLPPPTACPSP